MYLVNTKTRTIQECVILDKKSTYTVLQIGNEILGLPVEDEDYCLCEDYETACSVAYGCWFVPQ